MRRVFSVYVCGGCFKTINEGQSVFVIETVKKRVAKKGFNFVLVQVKQPTQLLLCKDCFNEM